MRLSLIAAITVLAAAVAGCAAVPGSRGGGLLAVNAFASQKDARPVDPRLIAALGGGIIANAPGVSLDSDDRRMALDAEYRALEYTRNGDAVSWRNVSTGRSGEVVAAQPYRVGSQDCRAYTHTLRGAGGPRTTRGTACRNADGSWTPLS